MFMSLPSIYKGFQKVSYTERTSRVGAGLQPNYGARLSRKVTAARPACNLVILHLKSKTGLWIQRWSRGCLDHSKASNSSPEGERRGEADRDREGRRRERGEHQLLLSLLHTPCIGNLFVMICPSGLTYHYFLTKLNSFLQLINLSHTILFSVTVIREALLSQILLQGVLRKRVCAHDNLYNRNKFQHTAMYFTNVCSILCDFMQLNLFIALTDSAFGLPSKDSDIQKIFGIFQKKVFFQSVQKKYYIQDFIQVYIHNRCFHLWQDAL